MAILPWLIDLLEHMYHLELCPTLTKDYEDGSKRIKGIAVIQEFLDHRIDGGKDQDWARWNRGLQTSLPKWLDW